MLVGRKSITVVLLVSVAILCAAVSSPARALASATRYCATTCQHGGQMAPCHHDSRAFEQHDDQGILSSDSAELDAEAPWASPAWDAPLVVRSIPAVGVQVTSWVDIGPPLFLRLLTLRR